ncbi:MAG: hypothetical protein ABSE06_17175 [Anaerolineaceae bacterium]
MAYQQRQIDTQEALRRLEELINEVNQAERERADKSMAPIAFAIYYLLKKSERSGPEALAVDMTNSFDKFPHWRYSPAQERCVREELYRILLKAQPTKKRNAADIAGLKELVDQIFLVASRAGSNA